MSKQLDDQIIKLKQTIADIESQRPIMGDTAVDISLEPFRQKLADLKAQAASAQEGPPVAPTRQRKLVTLLYMDVVGSTAMTQHLDPEDTLEIMDNALPLLAVPIKTHGGHVTRYTGDGFKAVFGDPVAREDDPEQAIRAGLDIIKEAEFLAQQLVEEWGMEDFQVRIGIDTGLAALGGQTEAEDTVMGRVVNLAVRIESAAPPGGLLISHNTYRHVRGVFNVEPQEPIEAKGFPEPVPVYLVRELKPRAFRVQTRGVEGVETRMVGREMELKHLQDVLLTAIEEGEGQVITISGEAGVGKSRLLYEFENWFELLPEPYILFFQGRGRQESQGLPYSLLRDMFAFRFQILDDDSGEQTRHKIETGFCVVFGEDEESVMRAHILGQLLGFDFSASPHLKGVLNDPEQLRNRGLMYLIQYFQAISKDNPIVVFLEDIHWGDNSSLDVISRLGEHTPELRLLIVGAARPTLFERRPYWGEGLEYHTLLELQPLSKYDSRQLVAEILKLAEDIPTQLRELVVSGAEGNPFYVEELIKMLIEDDVVIPGEETWRIELRRLEQVDVPSTLAGVLQARLDSLPGHERIVLQQASVVGRLFWDRIVSYIQAEGGNGGDPQLIPQALISLRNRELVYRHEESAFVGAVEYLFKHDVLREVTYESVLKRLRKTNHGLVADWLIENCGDRIGEYSGLIADHMLLAGRKELACEYFFRAGRSSLRAYANREAENYYRLALELCTTEDFRADIFSDLGEALYLLGHSEEAEQALRQAIKLYHQTGDSDNMADVFVLLSRLFFGIDYLDAWNVCQEGLESMVGAADSSGYARLLAETGRMAFMRNVTDQIRPLCQQAWDMAERVGELEVVADARITLALFEENIPKAIKEMEEIVELTEFNGFLEKSARVHLNLGFLQFAFLIDLNSSLRHSLRAVEIFKQIGNITAMPPSKGNVIEILSDQGELDLAGEKITEFFNSSLVPKSLANFHIQYNKMELSLRKGEWITTLNICREQLDKLRQGGSYQRIVYRNLELVRAITELNRFGSKDELSEAELALKENIEIGDRLSESNFLLVNVYIRQNRISAARDQFVRAQDVLTPAARENNLYKVLHANAEIELAQVEGRWEDALAACESSIEIYRNSGHLWGWARRFIDLGDILASRKEPGDLERARETYQQSLDMFTEMGAPGYIQVLEERLAGLGD